MRTCAKMRCRAAARATVALRYDAREVLVNDLSPQPDRNLVDLCEEHARTLVPPVGWSVRDDRNVVILTDAPAEATPPVPAVRAHEADPAAAETA